MLVHHEQRHQYLYFFLSGIVASAIVVLIYISLKTNAVTDFKNEIKIVQRSLVYLKPITAWHYNNSFRIIGNTSLRHEIYSAYFDIRINIIDTEPPDESKIPIGSLRIFAILPTKFKDLISCIIRYDDFKLEELQVEEAYAMHEDHGAQFSAYNIMCPVFINRNTTSVELPQAVAIGYSSNRLSHISPTFIAISYPKQMDQMFSQSLPVLSICVAPLQFNYTNTLRIVEFVEMYRILGASHFYFYVREATDEVIHVLQHYYNLGIADILNWNIHKQDANEIHYGGIVAQFNECIYRAMIVNNFRYAAIVDLDEILVPLKHNSLSDFLRQCDEGRTTAFVFRNVFYYKKDSNDTFSVPPYARNRWLYTQTKVRRSVELQPVYVRSKCIVNTRSVIEMGNHQVWRAADGYIDHLVHHTVGMLFHYRDKCINCRQLMVVDYTARRFGSLIWDRVDEACLHMYTDNGGICPTD